MNAIQQIRKFIKLGLSKFSKLSNSIKAVLVVGLYFLYSYYMKSPASAI